MMDVPEDYASMNGDDDDDGEISLAKIKMQHGFADDEEGTFTGTQLAEKLLEKKPEG